MIPGLGSLKVVGAMLLVMGVMVAGFYWYYQDSQKRIQTLAENNAKLETAVSINEETISSLQADQRLMAETLRQVNTDFAETRRQNDLLRERLSDNDIGVLAERRTELVERIINRASDRAARCLELLSGSPLTDEERNAESARSFNSECPWLWPGAQ